MERNLPNFLDNISKMNESVVSINERINVLEDSDTQITHGNRIGELEEAMETLRSTFSSLSSKNEKTFIGREQKFIYVPKVTKPMLSDVLKVASCFVEKITDASSLRNT